MINYFLTGLSALSFIFLIVSFKYILKQKKYEDIRLSNGINALAFGILLLAMFLLVKTFVFIDKIIHDTLVNISSLIPYYLSYVEQVTNSGVLLLVAASFFVAILLFREV